MIPPIVAGVTYILQVGKRKQGRGEVGLGRKGRTGPCVGGVPSPLYITAKVWGRGGLTYILQVGKQGTGWAGG